MHIYDTQELPTGYHLHLAPPAPGILQDRPVLPPPVPPLPPRRSQKGGEGDGFLDTAKAAGSQEEELGLASRLRFA